MTMALVLLRGPPWGEPIGLACPESRLESYSKLQGRVRSTNYWVQQPSKIGEKTCMFSPSHTIVHQKIPLSIIQTPVWKACL
ncbi:hypothetical protein TNCV_914901 [Trichonephila clavipes]|uniref:Uncharacterized protein n=1 Tax=Trichonephila clavipes TaxID=2585209 RepID=A0A8X6RM54_TRICX|nr:hypothetical protein TNCV_914901 [Trichonephila clavipes]